MANPSLIPFTDRALKQVMGAAVVSGWLTVAAAPATLPVLSVTLTAQPAVSAGPGASPFSFPIEFPTPA